MLIECIKIMKSKSFYLSFLALAMIVTIAAFSGSITHKEEYLLVESIYNKNKNISNLVSPHKQWIGVSGASNFASSLYYFIFPLLISIVLVDSIYREKASGNQNYLFIRMSQKKYYVVKFVTTYITAFLFFTVPLVLGVILVNLFTNHWDYSTYATSYRSLVEGTTKLPDDVFKGDVRSIFSNLLEISPYAYIAVYYVLGGLFASGYICMGLALSMFIENHYLVLFMPQIIYLACWAFLAVIGKPQWDPFHLISPGQGVEGLTITAIIMTLLLQQLIAIVIYLIGARKNHDVL